MRVVASVQAKRGSSRGLVHYIAHSKLDTEREPLRSRELFNAFTDSLSVKSVNNSMRIGVAKGRPSNDELHHLVLSFRNDDYRKLGTDEARRRQALKEITRAAMKRLEISTNAERLLWAAAVHRNTENPHVHIAIQKQYFSKEIERWLMTKIPREALPHYEIRDGEKVLLNGYLIDTATDKIEAIINRERTRDKALKLSARQAISRDHLGSETARKPIEVSPNQIAAEREALAKGILAEYELRRIGTRIDSLLDRGDEMRFTVKDPVTGRKRRVSLREIEQRGAGTESEHDAPARQIKTILYKMLAKEETAKDQLQNEFGDAIRESKRIRDDYRNSDRKLPVPLLTKEELHKLQEQCLEASDIRRFSYLERIRTELERSGDIQPRSKDDLRTILAQKTVSELRLRLYETKHAELGERGYYVRLDVRNSFMSVAQLDREQKDRDGSVLSILEMLKKTAERFSKKTKILKRTDETDAFRTEIANKLNEQLANIRKNGKAEQNKVKILDNILNANPEYRPNFASCSPEQIAEIEMLSIRLKLKPEYERNWNDQRFVIESARNDCPAFRRLLKADPTADFAEHKNQIIAGRVLAREIVARVEFDKAKEDLKTFQEGKRFQKFAVADKKSGSVAYFSLHDVELTRRGSLLDLAVEEVFEGREHRALRRTVASLVEDKEERLKDDVAAAKEIMMSASRSASEFKEFALFGLRSETRYKPIFTSADITALEMRAANTRNSREAQRLRTILESAADRPVRSTAELLRDFERPKNIVSEVKEMASQAQHEQKNESQERAIETVNIRRPSDRTLQHHSR